MLTITEIISKNLAERRRFWQNLQPDAGLSTFVERLIQVLENQGKLLIIGNGGSSSQASHLAAELVNRFYIDRPAIAALALTTDTANLTSIANDSDYRFVFSRQIQAVGRPGDMLLALTTGGTSPNIIEAIRTVKRCGIHCSVLCGNKTETLQAEKPDLLIPVDSSNTPTIQETHLFYIHLIAEAIELWARNQA